jgi:hypothetical protein
MYKNTEINSTGKKSKEDFIYIFNKHCLSSDLKDKEGFPRWKSWKQ